MSNVYDYPMDMAHYADMTVVADGECKIPVAAMRIIRYLDENGDECIYYDCEGDAQLPHSLGMLEWVKIALAQSALDPRADDDS